MTESFSLSIFTGGIASTNGYLLTCANGASLLIDAPDGIAAWLEKKKIRPSHLLLTHQHFDHVTDAAALQAMGAALYAFSPYSSSLTLDENSKMWGLPATTKYTVDHLLEKQSLLQLENLSIQLAHVPGHSPDSITYFIEQANTLFSGDTLFQQSIGRTDLPGHGNHDLLLQGIRNKLLTLPGETIVYPGHGDATSIADEIEMNPYL
jgi:glyoxylase-like metal-dependent hydrolase (beta-lactamase superfamily II)